MPTRDSKKRGKKEANDGINKVIGDIQDKFSQFKEDLETDVKEFNEKAKEQWESLSSKLDTDEVKKERDRLVKELNKRTDKFVKRLQVKLPGVGELQRNVDTLKRRITKLEAELAAMENGETPKKKAATKKKITKKKTT